MFTTDFLNTITQNLDRLNDSYHEQQKNIPHFDQAKSSVVKENFLNGFKFELFYFDCFPLADSIALIEVLREEEFAPVKNAENEDSPASARSLMSKLHQSWLEKQGVQFEGAASDKNLCEVDTALSYGGEGL